MEDAYRITLMPRPEATYRVLKSSAASLPSDPQSPNYYQLRPYAKMFQRVNSIFLSLMDPGNLHLDQPLLGMMSGIQTRTLASRPPQAYGSRVVGLLAGVEELDAANDRIHVHQQHSGPLTC